MENIILFIMFFIVIYLIYYFKRLQNFFNLLNIISIEIYENINVFVSFCRNFFVDIPYS